MVLNTVLLKKCTLVSYSFIIICNNRKAFTRRNSEVSGSSSNIDQELVDVVKEKDEIDSNGHIEGHIHQKKRRKSSQGKNVDQMKGEKLRKHFPCYRVVIKICQFVCEGCSTPG